ncbi:MAG: hypothetical protein E7543_03440 [Ruminococcaceae bacterium]|nr:hypothetical protein [Oscillospiraceae bacterium]
MPIEVNSITPRQKLTINIGLCEYQYIMENWQTNSEDFKAVFYDFYLKARWSVMTKPSNSIPYFKKLQSISPTDDLIDIISDLKEEMGQHGFEFSLSSKLLHTRNPSSPIYDSKIREYLSKEEKVEFWWGRSKGMYGSPAPRGTSECEKIRHDWINLCQWYNQFLSSKRCKEWINWFDDNFQNHTTISDVKKIDFIIFAST